MRPKFWIYTITVSILWFSQGIDNINYETEYWKEVGSNKGKLFHSSWPGCSLVMPFFASSIKLAFHDKILESMNQITKITNMLMNSLLVSSFYFIYVVTLLTKRNIIKHNLFNLKDVLIDMLIYQVASAHFISITKFTYLKEWFPIWLIPSLYYFIWRLGILCTSCKIIFLISIIKKSTIRTQST